MDGGQTVKRVRVLVIDDSAYNRRTISKILEDLPEVDVVGYATDGEDGMRKVVDLRPDLITLDLEMPKIDGFTLLRFIMAHRPTPVIVVSSLSGSDAVFKALELGAVDFVVKPAASISPDLQTIQRDLQDKVRHVFSLNLAGVKARHAAVIAQRATASRMPRPARTGRGVQMVAIGASTGGPPALQAIFSAFPHDVPVAFVVVQHMPATFTKSFADRLNRITGLRVVEACDGDTVEKGKVLVAPGGWNMTLNQQGERVVVKLTRPTAEYRYVPSVDATFVSCAEIFRSHALGVILTGMGNDGSKGVRAIKAEGGIVLAESEESAVVYGMPREAVATGVVDKVAALEKLVEEIRGYCLAG